MTGQGTGVLVMAHGTPDSLEEIESFYTSIRRGRPPTPELLADLVGRYQAIGGVSPLTERTQAQVRALTAALDAAQPGKFIVQLGTKHVDPRIEGAAASLAQAAVDTIVGLVLTPHQSSRGSGEYHQRAAAAIEAIDPTINYRPLHSWYDAAGFSELMATRLQDSLRASRRTSLDDPSSPPSQIAVLFTAHSLPTRVLAAGDRYPDQVAQSAQSIAAAAGLNQQPGHATVDGVSWSVAWQSAGRTADPWIGPDVLTEIPRVVAAGVTSIVICPVGFVSDHLEILYDLDIEATAVAHACGATLTRTMSLNDDPAFISVLASIVQSAAGH